MNAAQFCAEYGIELKNGAISFRKPVVDNFIIKYTNLSPNDFSDRMRKRLKILVMVDLHTDGYSKYSNRYDLPEEKIELPLSIFS